MSALLGLDAARAAVLAGIEPLPAVQVRLDEAVGLALAEDVVAPESVPSFVSSAMDGYAVRSVDLAAVPARLRVVGVTMAGDPPAGPVGPGEAVRIMTGAPVPAGADAVCMVEDSEPSPDGASVVLHRPATPDQHLRHPGEDVAAGSLVFAAGTVLTPRHLGVLASVGLATLPCRRQARVGVLSTGSELRPAGVPLGPGQIRESNRHLLLALVAEARALPVDLGLVDDDEDVLVDRVLAASSTCDVVLTSGGVSVGDRDVVRGVLDRLCPVRREVVGVAIKPAKPLVHGTMATGSRLVGLPGNPVSSLVSFESFVRPLLAALAGSAGTGPGLLTAIAAEDLRRRPDGKLHLVGAVCAPAEDGRLLVRRVAGQGSHQQRSVAEAEVLVHLPDGDGVAAGGVVAIQPIGRFAGFARPVGPGSGVGADMGVGAGSPDADDDCC